MGRLGAQRELIVETKLERPVNCWPNGEEEERGEIQEKGWEQYVQRHKGDRTSDIFKDIQGCEKVCRFRY